MLCFRKPDDNGRATSYHDIGLRFCQTLRQCYVLVFMHFNVIGNVMFLLLLFFVFMHVNVIGQEARRSG